MLNGFFSIVNEEVMNNDNEIRLRNFGVLKAKYSSPRKVKNVFGSGKDLTTKPKKSLKLKPAQNNSMHIPDN